MTTCRGWRASSLTALLAVAACAGGSSTEGDSTAVDGSSVESTDAFGTSVLIPSAGSVCHVTSVAGATRNGFDQLALQGAKRASAELGTAVEVIEPESEADIYTSIEDLIDAECTLIVTLGAPFSNATLTAAVANGDQQFAIVDFDYADKPPNILELNFNATEAAFLAGFLAAGVTESGTVATYGGINIAPVTALMDGFVNGVTYYNDQHSGTVQTLGWDGVEGAFVGSFEMPDEGHRMAAEFTDLGADIIFPVAGMTGLGSADFASEADEAVRIVGVDTDLFKSDTENSAVYLTSVLKNVDNAVFAAAAQIVANGSLTSSYLGTLENGGVALAPFHDQTDDVPDDLVLELEELEREVKAGNVRVS